MSGVWALLKLRLMRGKRKNTNTNIQQHRIFFSYTLIHPYVKIWTHSHSYMHTQQQYTTNQQPHPKTQDTGSDNAFVNHSIFLTLKRTTTCSFNHPLLLYISLSQCLRWGMIELAGCPRLAILLSLPQGSDLA
jgi:hypothetical protein